MPSGFDLLGFVLNIVQIIDVLVRYVRGYQRLERILKDAASRARELANDIRALQPLRTLDGVQSGIFDKPCQEIGHIRDELAAIEVNLSNRSGALKLLSSPEFVQDLNDMINILASKGDTFKMLGMIGAFYMEQRDTNAHVVSLFTQLNSKSTSSSEVETRLKILYQTRMVENNVPRRIGLDEKTGLRHFATGICLYEGRLGSKNFREAAQHFNVAIKAGKYEAFYFLGMLYKNGWGVERCNVTTRNKFQMGTDAGDAAAMTELGICYDMGIGVEKDIQKGTDYQRQGAEGGDPEGLANYAWAKLRGYKTDVNLSLAYNLAYKAVKKGYAKSEMACCYELGNGVDRNAVEAVKLYKEAIEDGTSWMAYLPLARCCEQGIGVPIDLAKAAEYYKKGSDFMAWKSSYFHAYYGLCLIRGRGVPEDKERGWFQVQKSIRNENASGWYVKGECYRFGYSVEIDLVQAATCYQNAIRTRNGLDAKIKAQFALGSMYELGQGSLGRDHVKAFEHFNFAANRLHQQAQWKIAVYCESGVGTDQFEDRAAHYFRLAANSGHKKAEFKASEYYMKGKGISRDLHTVVQVLESAEERADREAKRLLHRNRKMVFR